MKVAVSVGIAMTIACSLSVWIGHYTDSTLGFLIGYVLGSIAVPVGLSIGWAWEDKSRAF